MCAIRFWNERTREHITLAHVSVKAFSFTRKQSISVLPSITRTGFSYLSFDLSTFVLKPSVFVLHSSIFLALIRQHPRFVLFVWVAISERYDAQLQWQLYRMALKAYWKRTNSYSNHEIMGKRVYFHFLHKRCLFKTLFNYFFVLFISD